MPHVVETPIRAYAHCPHARCGGSRQVQVDATSTETNWLYTDNGGDLPGVERSQTVLAFVDPEEAACPSCGSRRELSDRPRPQYINESGHDPEYLISSSAKPYSAARQEEIKNDRVNELETELRDMKAQMAELIDLTRAAQDAKSDG